MSKNTIYKFNITLERELEETKISKKKNAKGEEEEVTTVKKVKKPFVHEISIYEPSRRQVEEADMEFSIEMSRCIKRGILTKAMLAKKYSDTGGLLAEEDAKALTKMYIRYGELSQESERKNLKSDQTKEDLERLKEITGEIAELRKDIINVETSYSNLFNHTADTRAENKVIQWYILNLTFLQKGDETKTTPMFEGNDFEQKLQGYYEMEEEGDELYDIVGGKIAALYSFWYYSSGAVLRDDFEKLDREIEEGKI